MTLETRANEWMEKHGDRGPFLVSFGTVEAWAHERLAKGTPCVVVGFFEGEAKREILFTDTDGFEVKVRKLKG